MKILVYPKAKNPYQDLLYGNKELKKISYYLYTPSNRAHYLSFFSWAVSYKKRGYTVFHIHWTYPFAIFAKKGSSSFNFIHKTVNTLYFIFSILWLRILSYKIVWTIHNLVPHEQEFLNDSLLMRVLAYIADAKVVHSSSTINQMKELNYSIEKTSVIPMGNYINVYTNECTKDEARKKLQIKPQSIVLLFFGLIRDYKGIEELLMAYKNVLLENKDVQLVIAGEVFSEEINKTMEKMEQEYPHNLKIHAKHIEDSDVQYYLNACDIVVLPFNKLTTSSTASLALSFRKPIIYPRMGNLIDIPVNAGFSFEASSIESLTDAIKKAIRFQDKLESKGMEGYKYISKFTWDESATKMLQIYKNL